MTTGSARDGASINSIVDLGEVFVLLDRNGDYVATIRVCAPLPSFSRRHGNGISSQRGGRSGVLYKPHTLYAPMVGYRSS